MDRIEAAPVADQRLVAIFREGQEMAEMGYAREDNPYTDDERASAWEAGWLEETGPAFTVSDRVRRDSSGATLADVWPASLRPLTSR